MSTTKTVLIIGFVWPEPTSSAAGTRMMQLITLFQSFHYNITFACAAQRSEHSALLNDIGVEEREIELNSDSFNTFVADLNPHIVIFDRFMVEEQYGWRVVEHCPTSLRILDTEDLHCLRKARHAAEKGDIDFDIATLGSQDIAKREIASIYRCDLALVISEFEIDLLVGHFNIDKRLLHYLPLSVNELASPLLPFDRRSGYVFIGNFLHEPNRDAVVYLKEVIWPLIRTQLKTELHIYGAYMPQQIINFDKPADGFIIHGRADSSADAISAHRVMLAPLRFGAGIKGKLLEAMQCGTPSVTTLIGAEGINGVMPWNGSVEDNPIAFANAAIALYSNEIRWHQAQQDGLAIIKARFDIDLFADIFGQRVEHLYYNLSHHRQLNFIGAMLQFHTLRSTEYLSRWIDAKNK